MSAAATSAPIGTYAFILRTSMARRDAWIGAVSAAAFVAILVVVLGNLFLALVGDRGSVHGYTGPMLVWYVAVAEAAVVSLDGRLIARIGEEIKFGDIITVLLRPLSFPWYRASEEVGAALVRAAVVAPASMAVAWAIAGPPPSPWLVVVLFTALPLALVLHTLQLVAMGGMTFWSGETRTTWFLYQKLVFLAGGMIPPLEFWPGRVGDVLAVLPWAGTAYAPAYLSVHGSPAVFVRVVGLQLFWIVACAGFMHWLHARGERRLVTEGG